MKRITKLFSLAVLALSLTAFSQAQTTTITASHLELGAFPISTGIVTFTPVSTNGLAIAFSDGSGAQHGPTAFACQVTAGAITGAITETGTTSGTCQVPDSTETTPANILYTAQVCDQSLGLRTSGQCYTLQNIVGISGATWALDHYGPPAPTSNVATLQAAQGTTVPTSCVAPSVFTLVNGSGSFLGFYTCVGGAEVAINSGGVGATGATGATGSAGTAATVSVGSTTTLAAGSPATVTNSGTASAAVLNFGIPQGAAGTGGGASSFSALTGTATPSQLPAATSSAQGAVQLPTGQSSNVLGSAAFTSSTAYDAFGAATSAISAAETYAAALAPIAPSGTSGYVWTSQGKSTAPHWTALSSYTYILPSGDTTGVADNLAIQTAITAQHPIQLSGIYYITGLSLSAPDDIHCTNLATTYIEQTSATANFITIAYGGGQPNNESQGMTIDNCNFTYKSGVTPTAGDVLRMTGPSSSAYLSGVHFQNNYMTNIFGGINLEGNLVNNYFTNNWVDTVVASGGHCLYYNTPSPGGDGLFDGFECTGSTAYANVIINQADTNTFANMKVNGGAQVIFTGGGSTNQVTLLNPSIEGANACGISFPTSGSIPTHIAMFGGEMAAGSGTAFCNYTNQSQLIYQFIDGLTADGNPGWVTNIYPNCTHTTSGGNSVNACAMPTGNSFIGTPSNFYAFVSSANTWLPGTASGDTVIQQAGGKQWYTSNEVNSNAYFDGVNNLFNFKIQMGPATAPSGSCTVNGSWAFSQDGHATFCASGTWTTKI